MLFSRDDNNIERRSVTTTTTVKCVECIRTTHTSRKTAFIFNYGNVKTKHGLFDGVDRIRDVRNCLNMLDNELFCVQSYIRWFGLRLR